VASGHTSGDLDYSGTSALALNSGTIKDAAGNAAHVVSPALWDAGPLGDAGRVLSGTRVVGYGRMS